MTPSLRFCAAALLVAAGFAEFSVQLGAHNGQLPANQRPPRPPAPPDPRLDPAQDARALDNLRSRAAMGDAEAQFQLAMHYRVGIRVPRDFDEAAAWLLRAAGQGHRRAQFELGILYQGLNGGPRDYVEAVAWLRTAAENGHVYALYNLAELYAIGRGVFRDPALACMWYLLAAYRWTGDNRDAMAQMAKFTARELTPAERREALRLAAEWDAAHPQHCGRQVILP